MNERIIYSCGQGGTGDYYIWGEIGNGLAVPIYDPSFVVTFYDASDNVVAPQVSGEVENFVMVLDAQDFGPFRYRAYGPCSDMDRIVRYEIATTFNSTYNGWTSLPFDRYYESSAIERVVVRNPYSYPIQGLKLVKTTYDELGDVYDASYDYVGNVIYPGYSWTFYVSIPNRSYRLQAQGRQQ